MLTIFRDAIAVCNEAANTIRADADVIKSRSKQHQREFTENLIELQAALYGVQQTIARLELFDLTRAKKNELAKVA